MGIPIHNSSFKTIKPSLGYVYLFLPPLGKAHNVRFFLAGVECRSLHKDPPPVLHRSRAQPAAGRPDAAEAEAAPVGHGDAAAPRFGAAVELLLDHLVEKSARKGEKDKNKKSHPSIAELSEPVQSAAF